MKQLKVLLPIAASGLALALTACGGPAPTAAPSGSAPASSAPSGSASTPAESAGWDIKETPREKLKEGGEFIGSISHEIPTWNIYSAAGNDSEEVQLTAPISAAYYDYNGVGDAILNPDYLVSADEAVNGGKLTITLKLNPKAVWNDGEVIGADDWIATWKAMNGENKDFSVASSDGWDQIESIKAGATQQDVIITFKSTYPDWTAIISGGPLRAEGVATPKDFNDGWGEPKDAYFTGPYKITSWDKTSGTVVMEPNPNWWGAKPFLTKLTWKQIPAESVASAFANRELDYIDIGADADAYQQASNTPDTEIRVAAGPNYRQFTFNAGSEVLKDQNVRQAIVMGLNREIIAKADLAGLPGDPQPLNNNLFVMGQKGYVDEAKATGIDYNPEGAKQKLEAAGYTMGSGGFYEKDGKQLDVEFAVLGGVKASETEGLQAQNQLKEIGVNLKLRTIDTTKDWPAVLTDHKFDIIAFSWIGTPYPLNNIGQIYGGGIDSKTKNWVASDSNYAQLQIPEVDTLKPQVDTEMDAAKRLELGNQAAEAIWTAVHTLPLYQRPMLIGVPSDLANIGAQGMARVPKWENVGYLA